MVKRRGLSPRGRGNPVPPPDLWIIAGSIPAWAGEPGRHDRPARARTVYPRVGGGTIPIPRASSTAAGLSPRGRGNLLPSKGRPLPSRSIPAWAGEPSTYRFSLPSIAVYPRVGGGTRSIARINRVVIGLSPRGRGNPSAAFLFSLAAGSIPAWAGEPDPRRPPNDSGSVYPRVGGGTFFCRHTNRCQGGLSPRGRGNLVATDQHVRYQRSIPAWAGEPFHSTNPPRATTVYPRVGGGTGPITWRVPLALGLSPRGRGNRSRDTYTNA